MLNTLPTVIQGYSRIAPLVCKPPRSRGVYIPRTAEVARLLSLLENGVVPLVYGPRGAGKTTMLRCLARSLPKLGIRVLYIGLHAHPPLMLGETPANIREYLPGITSRDGYERGAAIARLAKSLGRNGLLIVDDFNLGLGDERMVGQVLRALYETMGVFEEIPHVILATSEAVVTARLYSLLVGNIVPALWWHMSRRDAAELASKLGYKGDVETLYKITGGSPDAIVSIMEHRWKTEEWIEYRVKPKVEEALEALRELGVLVEKLDPDYLGSRRSVRTALLEYNLLVRLVGVRLSDMEKSEYIGEKWAWQLPAYLKAAETLMEKISLPRPALEGGR